MRGLVPVIDPAPVADSEEGTAAVARQVGTACEDVGFFLIAGHGVPDATIAACWAAARRFFDLPRAGKELPRS